MELVTASTMLSMLALVAAAYTVLDLVVFAACPAAALSDDPAIEHHRIPPVRLGRSLTRQLTPLAGNCLLVVLFALQHSVLASKALKRISGIPSPAYRALYTLASCVALQMVATAWQGSGVQVWATDSALVAWVCQRVLQPVALAALCCQAVALDVQDMAGLRGAVYHAAGWGDPAQYDSAALQAVREHVRHPVLTAPLLLLLATPALSLDRLLLAVAFWAYTVMWFRPTAVDVAYVKAQFWRGLFWR